MEDRRPLYIIDASVIVKWLIEEKKGKLQAFQIKEDFIGKKIRLKIPNHCFFEVMNVLGIKAPAIAIQFLSQLLTLKMEEAHLTIEIGNRAIQIMKEFSGISFYDAAYHALAIEAGGTFITADKKYFGKVKDLKHIKLLEE